MKDLFLLFCVVILCACAPSEAAIQTAMSQTQAAIPTSTSTYTNTPTNTATFTPTFTPTKTPKPTKTPIPTYTKKPTFTPTKTWTEEERNIYTYSSKMVYLGKEWIEIMNVLQGLTQIGALNPYMMYTSNWKSSMVLSLNEMLSLAQQMKDVEPVPDRFLDVDKLYDTLFDETKLFVDYTSRGVIQNSVYYINLGSKQMEKITKLINEINEMLTALNE